MKRKEAPRDSDFSADDEQQDFDVPSDVQCAILYLQGLMVVHSKYFPRLVLKDHIYTVVHDRTDADRMIEELRRSNHIRLINLSASNGIAVMNTSDYLETLKQYEEKICSTSQKTHIKTIQKFRWVLEKNTSVSITAVELKHLMVQARDGVSSSGDRKAQIVTDDVDLDEAISWLVSIKFLRPRRDLEMHERDAFWFSVPKIGSFVSSLTEGRKEVLAMIGRKSRKECLMRVLTKNKLRRSVFSMEWHVMDLVATGAAVEKKTASGALIMIEK